MLDTWNPFIGIELFDEGRLLTNSYFSVESGMGSHSIKIFPCILLYIRARTEVLHSEFIFKIDLFGKEVSSLLLHQLMRTTILFQNR